MSAHEPQHEPCDHPKYMGGFVTNDECGTRKMRAVCTSCDVVSLVPEPPKCARDLRASILGHCRLTHLQDEVLHGVLTANVPTMNGRKRRHHDEVECAWLQRLWWRMYMGSENGLEPYIESD